MEPSLIAFVVAALVVLIVPGPGVLYVVTRSLGQGRRAGLVSAAGLSLGAMAHVIAATVGVGAVLMASATAFAAVKYLGACYLIYLGVQTFRSREPPPGAQPPAPRSLRRLFGDGVVVSVLNPKIAIFFLAFLPQFVDPTRGPIAVQLLLLGTLYCVLALVTDGAYALLASRVRDGLHGRFGHSPLPRYAAGSVYIGLGVGTALTDPS